MIKLSNSQVRVLAKKISSQINENYKDIMESRKQEIRKSNEYKSLLIDLESIYNQIKRTICTTGLPLDVSCYINCSPYRTVGDSRKWIRCQAEEYVKCKYESLYEAFPHIYEEDIRDEIILETIESKNLDELTAKIMDKYDQNNA